MSYLHLKEVKGARKGSPNATAFANVPYLYTSHFGSKKSNSSTPSKRLVSYAQKNARKENRLSRQG